MKGSSPRGRGKQVRHRRWERKLGLIPARAGKTSPKPSGKRPEAAHPRAGGENYVDILAGKIKPGSSPRGRGKHRR